MRRRKTYLFRVASRWFEFKFEFAAMLVHKVASRDMLSFKSLSAFPVTTPVTIIWRERGLKGSRPACLEPSVCLFCSLLYILSTNSYLDYDKR
jgi:hypothetical protein